MSRPIRQAALLSLPLLVLVFVARVPMSPRIAAQAPIATAPGGPPLFQQFYHAGWNLVSVTQRGIPVPTGGSIYTLTPEGTDYQAVSPTDTQRGVGYWVFFPTDNLINLVPVPLCEECATNFPSIPLPAGQWVMIGNPYAPVPITVSGADVVDVYDATKGDYQQATRLFAGQGAFAYSASGGRLIFSQ